MPCTFGPVNHRFEIGKYGLFDIETFNDGFNDQVAWGQCRQTVHALKSTAVVGDLLCRQTSFFSHLAPLGNDAVASLMAGLRLRVEQQHLAAGLCRDLCDATAHGPGADHGDRIETVAHVLDYRPGPSFNDAFAGRLG